MPALSQSMNVGKSRRIGLTLLAALLLANCSADSGSGASMSVPTVRIECATAACKAVNSADVYITLTTSNCSNSTAGGVATSSVVASCNGSTGCRAEANQWSNLSGRVSTIIEGIYSFCVTIDRNSNYAGYPATGDVVGTQQSDLRAASTLVVVSQFTDL